MDSNELHFRPTVRQWAARQVLDIDKVQPADSPPIELCYGGAKGGGKSYFFCFWVMEYCRWVIHKFNLKESSNPPHIGFMGRKLSTDFTQTTLATWRENIPDTCYEFKGSGDKDVKHIIVDGRVAVDYGGLDRQADINKFNSAEYGFIAIDQAEETTIDDVAVLKATRRMKINNEPLPYRGLWTANPAQCWLKSDFIDTPKNNHFFIQALPGDNNYLPESYIETLKSSFGHRPELLQAYLYGSWDAFEGANQVILGSWISRAMGMPTMIGGRVISCDVARFGDDKTIIYVMDGTNVTERTEMGYSRTTDISDKLTEMSRVRDNCAIVVDEIGVGGGVIDELHKNGRRVISFNSSNKADDPEKFYNLRAEAWWELGQHFAKGEIGCMDISGSLRNELTIPTYEFRNGKVLLEPKEAIKKRLGHSPDEADCYVMGVWAVKRVMPEMEIKSYDTKSSSYDNNVLTRGLAKTA